MNAAPAHPPHIREDVKDAIKRAALAAFPKEAWGFIVRLRGGRVKIMGFENAAADPYRDYRSSAGDWVAAENEGQIELIWHTHPNGKPEATMADMRNSESNKLPILIYATPADLWCYYAPHGYEAPYLNRPFVQGVLDCYELIRDYYRIELGILLPNFPHRPHNWWWPLKQIGDQQIRTDKPGQIIAPAIDMYVQNFEAAGFRRVEGRLRKYDCIMMRLVDGPICHAALYLGDGIILHHPPQRLSCRSPYEPGGGGYYSRTTEFFVRHESLFDVPDVTAPPVGRRIALLPHH